AVGWHPGGEGDFQVGDGCVVVRIGDGQRHFTVAGLGSFWGVCGQYGEMAAVGGGCAERVDVFADVAAVVVGVVVVVGLVIVVVVRITAGGGERNQGEEGEVD